MKCEACGIAKATVGVLCGSCSLSDEEGTLDEDLASLED
jgi:hypothetical protein